MIIDELMEESFSNYIIRPYYTLDKLGCTSGLKIVDYRIYTVPDNHRIDHYRKRYIFTLYLERLFSDIKFESKEDALKFLESIKNKGN